MSNNTKESFKNKWEKNPDVAFQNTIDESSEIFNWIINRNGFSTAPEFSSFLADKKRILDAGCGNGRVTYLLRKYTDPIKTQVVGIDLVAAKVAQENLKNLENMLFFEKDLLGDLSDLGKFDFIYCQEVLHHTNNPLEAFKNLIKLLDIDGEIAIYVYKKKAPVREFVDDYIRDKIVNFSYEDAMIVNKQITELGQALSKLDIKIKIPQVDILEIKEGEYDIQRFIYHFFMKCFWNDELSFHDNQIINYDWYHPQNCSRHTLDEIKAWFEDNDLKVVHSYEDFYGITMRGKK